MDLSSFIARRKDSADGARAQPFIDALRVLRVVDEREQQEAAKLLARVVTILTKPCRSLDLLRGREIVAVAVAVNDHVNVNARCPSPPTGMGS